MAAARVALPESIAPRPVPQGATLQHMLGATMGTTWSVRFYGSPAARQTLHREVLRVFDLVIAQMSPWQPQSTLSRLNHAAIGAWLTVPVEFCAVASAALRIAHATDGAFDPSVGTAVAAWGFGPEGSSEMAPAPRVITATQSDIGWRHLELDVHRQRIRRNTSCALDLNGIAKGYAVDLVMDALRRHGIHHALVEIGGELRGAGNKPDGSPWWVDVDYRDGMRTRRGDTLRVALHGLAIATSGCERAVIRDGMSMSHTIDPRTARPIAGDTVAATVLHASCMEADAYATAFMVMAPQHAIALADRSGLAAAIAVRQGDAIVEMISAGLGAMLG